MSSAVRFVIWDSDMAVKDFTTTSPIYACVQRFVSGSPKLPFSEHTFPALTERWPVCYSGKRYAMQGCD